VFVVSQYAKSTYFNVISYSSIANQSIHIPDAAGQQGATAAVRCCAH
jgi:hypothetical protein